MRGGPIARSATSTMGIGMDQPARRLPRQQAAGEILIQLPRRRGAGPSDVCANQVQKRVPGNLARAERGQMGGLHLAVDDAELPTAGAAHQWTNASFEASGTRVNIDSPKNARPRRRRRGRPPAARPARPRSSARGRRRGGRRRPAIISSVIHVPAWLVRGSAHAGHDVGERQVGGDREVAAPNPSQQRPRHVQFAGHQHHAWIRTPPQHRLALAEPGEAPARVRLERAGDRQPAAGCQQAVGPPQRALHRRQRVVVAGRATGCSSAHYAGLSQSPVG